MSSFQFDLPAENPAQRQRIRLTLEKAMDMAKSKNGYVIYEEYLEEEDVRGRKSSPRRSHFGMILRPLRVRCAVYVD